MPKPFDIVDGDYVLPDRLHNDSVADWGQRFLRIDDRLSKLIATESDINQHLQYLFETSKAYRHVTEFGVRYGASTTALLAGQMWNAANDDGEGFLHSYDIHQHKEVADLQALGRSIFTFHHNSTLECSIQPTEMLFIDTYHTYAQLKLELMTHSGKVWKRLVFHDTVTFGERGEDGGVPGLLMAINELIESGHWKRTIHHQFNNGLMVLDRTPESKRLWVETHGREFLLVFQN